jgi:hypothetical protein
MTAILKEDPPEFDRARADIPAALDRIIRHCLEKNVVEQFQSARDVAFALEALSGSAGVRYRQRTGDCSAGAKRRSTGLAIAAALVPRQRSVERSLDAQPRRKPPAFLDEDVQPQTIVTHGSCPMARDRLQLGTDWQCCSPLHIQTDLAKHAFGRPEPSSVCIVKG